MDDEWVGFFDYGGPQIKEGGRMDNESLLKYIGFTFGKEEGHIGCQGHWKDPKGDFLTEPPDLSDEKNAWILLRYGLDKLEDCSSVEISNTTNGYLCELHGEDIGGRGAERYLSLYTSIFLAAERSELNDH